LFSVLGGDGTAGVEQEHKSAARTDGAPDAGQSLDPSIRGDELQRSVDQHDVEAPLDVQIKQILPERFN
jgi:hypothetical protein